jgi:pyruvate dehydrogenase E1 component alpha subunit
VGDPEPNERPGCRCTAARRLRLPGIRVDSNDVLACLPVGAGGVRTGNARAHRGVHLPDGRPHDLDDPSRYRLATSSGLEADPLLGTGAPRARRRRERLRDELAAESDALAIRLRAYCRAMPQPGPSGSSPTSFANLTGADHDRRCGRYCASFDGSVEDCPVTVTMAKALNDGSRAAMEDDGRRDG